MEFGLSEEQTLLQDSVSRFLEAEAPLDRIREFSEQQDDGDIWRGLTEMGISGLLIPESAGGSGVPGCRSGSRIAGQSRYSLTLSRDGCNGSSGYRLRRR